MARNVTVQGESLKPGDIDARIYEIVRGRFTQELTQSLVHVVVLKYLVLSQEVRSRPTMCLTYLTQDLENWATHPEEYAANEIEGDFWKYHLLVTLSLKIFGSNLKPALRTTRAQGHCWFRQAVHVSSGSKHGTSCPRGFPATRRR